jgi:uncharacterized membrane protein
VSFHDANPLAPAQPDRSTFAQDLKRFFLRGLATLLPTLITLWLLVWAWDFLWNSLGYHIVETIRWLWPESYLAQQLGDTGDWMTRLYGVALAVLLVFIVGFFVGNLIGRTFWKLGETLAMKIPVIRAVYPAVKQVTDFILADRSHHFQQSRVVAVQPHEKGIWSIGLVTGEGLKPMDEAAGEKMVMVFLPNSPAAFSGYVVVVPRAQVVELPLTVEEAMRLLVSGGVIIPGKKIGPGGKIIVETGGLIASPPEQGHLNHSA